MNRAVDPEPVLDVRHYWRIIVRKHRGLIASCVLASVVLTGILVLVETPIYKATSLVMIEPRAPQILNMKELLSEPPDTNEYDFYKTQYDILRSRSLAGQVISDLHLKSVSYFNGMNVHPGVITHLTRQAEQLVHAFLVHNTRVTPGADDSQEISVDPALVDAYIGGLSVEPRIGTHLVTVGFSAPDRILSARIANAHVRAYIRRGIDLHEQASSDAQEFLQKKLFELKERLENSEGALNAYRRERGIVTFSLHDTNGVIIQHLTDLNSALTKAETARIALAAQYRSIQNKDYDSLPEVINSPLIQALKEQVASLESEYAAMRNRFNPGYHPLDDLGARLTNSRARLRSEINSVVQSVELNYREALTKERELNRQIEQVKSRAMALHDASLQDAVLAREVDTNRQLYASVLERVKEIGVSADLPTSNVSIVDRAEIPRVQSRPRVFSDLAIGGFLGLCIGIAMAFLFEHLDDRLKDPEEAERYLTIPSLAVVPSFARLTKAPTAYGVTVATGTGLKNSSDDTRKSKEIVVIGNRLPVAGEIYRSIRTSLLFSRAGNAPRTILITSATGGEGKTVTAINTALAFAQTGMNVLLIDTDLRRPRCHTVLGLDNNLGLTQILVGQRPCEEVVHHIEYVRLSFLSSGPSSPQPSELLASDQMRELLIHLSSQYNCIILDSAPIIPVSDTVAPATMVDGVLLVVGPDTPKKLVRTACTRLNHVGAKILGVVLNRVNTKHLDADHYYNHYHLYETEHCTPLS
jgi:polysaccharide biosynthesis transport protein